MSGPLPLHEVPRRSPTNVVEAIPFYAEHKLRVTPVRADEKKGRINGWSQPGHNAAPGDFRVDDNIGVLNGTEVEDGYCFYDVDIDTDHTAARRVVEQLLPPTGWWYGRASHQRSHANYLVKGLLRTRRYPGVEKHSGLELRGMTQKGTHTFSVAPGSTWVSQDQTKREPNRCVPGSIGGSR